MKISVNEELKDYIISLIEDVPNYVYEGLLSVFCVGAVLLLTWKGKKALQGIAKLLLSEYVFLIYCSTVIFRDVNPSRGHYFTPFWSYSRQDLIAENIMNVVVFIPIGILLFITQKKRASQLKAWIIAIVSGFAMSVGIESLQLIFKKGYAEVDDLMHNTLGCFIGCTLCLLIAKTWSCSMNWCRLHWGKESC